MTDASQAIARLRELRGLATKGKWSAFSHPELGELSCYDAAAIVAAMNSLESLLACASVLADIAAQKTGAELDEDQYEHADFEGGYGIIIDKARAALQALSKTGETNA
jgi:hypothetical protein